MPTLKSLQRSLGLGCGKRTWELHPRSSGTGACHGAVRVTREAALLCSPSVDVCLGLELLPWEYRQVGRSLCSLPGKTCPFGGSWSGVSGFVSGFAARFGTLFACQPLDSGLFCLKGGKSPKTLHSWGQEGREKRSPEYLVWAVWALRSHASRWITWGTWHLV